MKKVISIFVIFIAMMAIVIGCASEQVDNALSEELEESSKIENVTFLLGGGVMGTGKVTKEDCVEDIELLLDIFKKVSSDGEVYKEYEEEGFYKLYYPSICIEYSSGEVININWEIEKGILTYNDTDYYVDKEKGKEIYDVFIKYCPPVTDFY